ncbi:hypothetical protein FRC15_007561 [Serendipita sp. 397]|nr:hypothetical protein FRC15_007561 [Serendipita sp. 397]
MFDALAKSQFDREKVSYLKTLLGPPNFVPLLLLSPAYPPPFPRHPRSPHRGRNIDNRLNQISQSSTAEVDGAKFDGVLEQKKRLVVLRLDDFFKAVFPNVVLTPEEEKRMNKNKQCLSYINLKEIKAEPGLSAQVVS